MNTLGNRGERDKNAKPKFSTLDINNLYRTSRGETTEPTAQKNAVPRKHGMQSLGKVPSARRPPANLPSLKAETSAPLNTSSSSNDQQQQQSQNQSNSSAQASWADSSVTSQNSGGEKSIEKSQSSSGDRGGNTSWSAVANRKIVKEDNAMLYQSPQFQNEFPSLDGSTTTSSTMTNVNANATKHQQNPNSISHGGDSNESHAHMKSTDSGGNWTQNPQHSNSGNARGGGAENGPSVYEAATNTNVPRTILALMPSFIKSKVQPADNNSGSPPPQQQQQQQSSNSSSSMHRDHHRDSHHRGDREQQHRGDREQNYQREQRRGNNYGGRDSNYEYSNGPPRHQRQHQPPRLAGRSHNDDRSSSYEPEVIVQRPIIKDEELDRIDSLAKDDVGWSKHDEIDYNKKLQFSDDEIDDEKPKESGNRHALRDNDRRELSKQQNGPMGRSVDQQLIEKMNKRREEEERMERERKLAAQKKLMELEEKSKSKDKDGGKMMEVDDKLDDRKKESRGSVDYGKKYDKYDSYDRYNRGGANENFNNTNKSSFQSNLPPRFQKQQLDHRHSGSQEKPGPPGFKPMMDNKTMAYSQSSSSYEQRWGGYNNKQQQQQPSTRRNMSSLSQSSSDDNNRRDNVKNYPRRHPDEDDDYRKKSQAQTTRSVSESSDKLSDHNRSEKSTSREQLGVGMCWSESMENEKKSRRVSESSAMSDDQPRTILQRNKPLQEQLKEVKNEIKEEVKIEKSVLSETSADNDEKKEEKIENKKNLESIPEKEQKDDKKDSGKALKEIDDRHKKSSPRSNNYDTRYSRGGYGSYRGSDRGGMQGYSRRGNHRGGHSYDYNSDSDNSEEYDHNWKNKMGRKNLSYGQKEGFTPRGEPSRRGRGGGSSSSSTTQSSNFRRSGSNGAIQPPAKNYGPPSSKSPFGSNDEKLEKTSKDKLSDDDRTKQKQKAFNEGLLNKSQKESTNVATQKASSPAAKTDDSKQQHSTEQTAALSSCEKDKKLEEELRNAMGQRSASSSSFNSNQGKKTNVQSKTATTTTIMDTLSSSTKPNVKEIGNPKTSPSSQPQFTQQKQPSSMPPNRNDRTDRNDARNPNNSNQRMAPRFSKTGPGGGNPAGNPRLGTYWDKNTENEDKMSLNMLNNAPSNSISNNSSSNLLNSKTDMIKQSSQQQHQQSIQQQQQQQQQSQSMMDGPLKNTLIFENTNYKTAGPPGGIKRPQMGQPTQKQDNSINTINEMIDQQTKEHQSLSSALQNLSFGQKPQNDIVNDMNFSYNFDTQIGHNLLGDDRNKSFGVVSSSSNSHPSQTVSKSSSLGLVGAKTGMQSSNILNTDALNMKVASCKKVWEDPSSIVDHSGSGTTDDVMSNFVQQQQHLHQYGHHTGLLEHSLEHFNKSNDNDDGTSYPSPGQQQHMVHSQSQQQAMKMSAADAVFASGKAKQSQQGMHQTGLSPPPQLQQSQLQQQQQQQQQTYYSTPNYSNMPTIPSPPAVYPQQAAASGMYSHYNMDARAQMYGYPTGNANNSMSFGTFMQTPNLASVPTHDMYQNLSQYRTTVQPFNQTPQINNPNAVLIQSATASGNSMMNSKSSSHIGAIGSKSSQNAGPTAAGPNQYGQQYMNQLYHQQHNSYYTNSTAQQQNPYYSQGPTGTSAAASGNYGMFPSHGTNNGPPPQPQQMANFGSVGQFPIGSQMLNNLVINQQYRSGPVVPGNNGNNASGSNSNAPSGYMKQQHQSQLQDPWDSPPANFSYQQNRMFNSPQQSSSGMQSQSRWPTPIQRPPNNNNNFNNRGSPSPQYTSYQNYQQRPTRNMQAGNSSTMTSQGKSQNFSHSSKMKHDHVEKPKTHLPTDDSKQ